MLSSMSSTAEKLESARAALQRARSHNTHIKQGIYGTVAATAGGLIGAAVNKYLPQLVPGDGAADTASVMLVDIATQGLCVVSGDPTWMAFANGMHGYLSGKTAEIILP